jgi:hypothetical protein
MAVDYMDKQEKKAAAKEDIALMKNDPQMANAQYRNDYKAALAQLDSEMPKPDSGETTAEDKAAAQKEVDNIAPGGVGKSEYKSAMKDAKHRARHGE